MSYRTLSSGDAPTRSRRYAGDRRDDQAGLGLGPMDVHVAALDPTCVHWWAPDPKRAGRPPIVAMHGWSYNERHLFAFAGLSPGEMVVASVRAPFPEAGARLVSELAETDWIPAGAGRQRPNRRSRGLAGHSASRVIDRSSRVFPRQCEGVAAEAALS